MVFSCCLVPCSAQIQDEEFERATRKSKESEYIRWRRNTGRSKSRSRSKRDKSSSKKGNKKKTKEKELEAEAREYDSREESDDTEDDGDDEVSRSPSRWEQREKLNELAGKKEKEASASVRSERSKKGSKDSQVIFREQKEDERTVITNKSEPLPPSLPKSILADSFYSDDSLDNGDLTFEVDYGTSTPLFEALELNDWGNVLFFLRAGKFIAGGTLRTEDMDDPETQVRTWVHCQDDRGSVMWRQLPLHAAICLAAPLVVVQRLVEVYPDALACQDSFGNLPLNLAAKLHGTESFVFQVVSIKSQRWLQSREEADDGEDVTTVTTERTERTGSAVPSSQGPSGDRPMTPLSTPVIGAMLEKEKEDGWGDPPGVPVNPQANTRSILETASEEGLTHRPGTPTKQPPHHGMSIVEAARDDGWEHRPGTPTKRNRSNAFVQRLQESFDATYSSTDESSESEHNLHDDIQNHRDPYGSFGGNDAALLDDDDNELELYYHQV